MRMFESSLAPRTRFDLNFRIGDIPVRVHPFFWLTSFFLGFAGETRGSDLLVQVLIACGVVFVSILVHELGHVLMGRFFGAHGHILLWGFGGLAIGSSELEERWQRNLVYFAGPAAGFVLAAVTAGVFWLYNPFFAQLTLSLMFPLPTPSMPPDEVVLPSFWALEAFHYLLWINVYWGLINLLPIWPLDGGQICREACLHYRRYGGELLAARISLFAAGGICAIALFELVTKKTIIPYLHLGSLFVVIMFGILAFNSYQLMQFLRRGGGWEEEQRSQRAPWERDPDWWKRGGGSGYD